MDALARRRELRQRLADQRRALPPTERIAAAQGLRRSLEQLPEYLTDTRVAGYWASHGELPLNLAIAPLAGRGQQFLLPVITAGRQLRFAPWQAGDEVQPNRYGIPEPVAPGELLEPFQLDLILVPLLGFDRHGHRLGHGGGYYDRSFAFLNEQVRPTEPLLVGIAYAFQELPAIEEAEWDVPLDFVATERELIDCHAPAPHPETAA
ncbi:MULTISPECIES: 5-formyltetrahydrofolate cyclo-ligase [Rhodanobacter]|uniref:5-formyltetrahydrofolate cyclo-ligase n=3 Tax=Rhodanobacteraceae TaxID=1775411 RepID=UPI0009137099|nr:5-formyltetrahydrofolate cyclo-ligase [Rhodanobacter thiooxydans]TAN16352.1 MAG: 5-formyltetrahydrofolate cyclo-ligase [Rhodanobacter sp.]UJJ54601.1 5-formyltetrahydrofolate cyclo-ligase [Rhodanobacter thiooxydans]